MNKNYVVYHLHTELSLLDSCTNHKLYTDKAKSLGQKAIAFTEHGNIYKWIEKKMYCDKQGIKYIHGFECYITTSLSEKIRDNYHTILLAKNYEGVKEINSLTEQYLNIDQLEENIILKQFRNEKEELKKEIAKHQVIIDNQSRAIKVSYMDKINGIISEEQFIEFNSDFSRNIEEQKKIIANKKLKLAELENEQETLKSKRELLQKYVNVTELTREMIDNLIDYIEVGAKDPITKKKTIEIHWKI